MMRHHLAALAIATTLASSPAAADCFGQAATRYGINIDLLAAIADVESDHRNHVINTNADGSTDVCLMQINSNNFPALQRRFGITRAHLDDPCTCVHVGAWFLADEIRRNGPTWLSVARYRIGSKSTNMRAGLEYAHKVKARYELRRRAREAGQ